MVKLVWEVVMKQIWLGSAWGSIIDGSVHFWIRHADLWFNKDSRQSSTSNILSLTFALVYLNATQMEFEGLPWNAEFNHMPLKAKVRNFQHILIIFCFPISGWTFLPWPSHLFDRNSLGCLKQDKTSWISWDLMIMPV